MTEAATVSDELERLKKQCIEMTQTLNALEKEEIMLQTQNEILAREAILAGYQSHVIEPPAPKRRRAVPKKNAAEPKAAS